MKYPVGSGGLEAVVLSYYVERGFLEILQNSPENVCARV